jgi:hypothetical protein
MLLIILGSLFVIVGTCIYFAAPTQNSLIALAWNDASYSFGSSKWTFLYVPSFDSAHRVVNLDFPFPYFSINPGALERLHSERILMTACTTTGQNEVEGRLLNATLAASYSWNGLEITVSEVNPTYVVLSLKSLS